MEKGARFKRWLRICAVIVLACFLPQQVVEARGRRNNDGISFASNLFPSVKSGLLGAAIGYLTAPKEHRWRNAAIGAGALLIPSVCNKFSMGRLASTAIGAGIGYGLSSIDKSMDKTGKFIFTGFGATLGALTGPSIGKKFFSKFFSAEPAPLTDKPTLSLSSGKPSFWKSITPFTTLAGAGIGYSIGRNKGNAGTGVAIGTTLGFVIGDIYNSKWGKTFPQDQVQPQVKAEDVKLPSFLRKHSVPIGAVLGAGAGYLATAKKDANTKIFATAMGALAGGVVGAKFREPKMVEVPKAEVPKVEPPQVEAPKVEAVPTAKEPVVRTPDFSSYEEAKTKTTKETPKETPISEIPKVESKVESQVTPSQLPQVTSPVEKIPMPISKIELLEVKPPSKFPEYSLKADSVAKDIQDKIKNLPSTEYNKLIDEIQKHTKLSRKEIERRLRDGEWGPMTQYAAEILSANRVPHWLNLFPRRESEYRKRK